jgi:predicted permease
MRFWNRFRLRARGGRLETELNDEIRLHREMLEEEFVRQGMSPGEAAKAAAQQFGNTSAAADQSRDEWTFPRIDVLWKDIKFALRMTLRNPLLTGAAVLTVAFGVGANTAILSVLETVLLNPLGMRHTERVMVARVNLEKIQMHHAPDSGVEFRELHSMPDAFSAVAAMEGRAWTYQTGGQAVRLLGQAVTPEFFQVFSASPAVGRFITEEDRESVVLSYEMWQSQFGGGPGVIGRALTLDDKPYRVVGVTPKDFRFPADARAWSPLILSRERLSRRGNNMNLLVLARRRAGIGAAQAAGRVDGYVAGLKAAPGGGELAKAGYGIELNSFAVYLAGDLRRPLWLLWTAALVVLLTGCANVAGLLLTRSASRRKEIAIRLSVGATRLQVVRQLLLESLLLGALGGLAGLAMATLAVSLVTRVAVPGRQVLALVSLNERMLLYGLGLAMASGLLFGIVPALQLLRDSQTSAMARSRRRWFQDVFVTAEVGSAFVLVVMTGLLLRSLWAVEQIQPGFDPQHLTTAYFTKPRNDPSFQDRLKTELQSVPGVESAAMAYPAPFTTGGLTSSFSIRNRVHQPGEPEWHGEAYFVTPEYLRTLRIPLLRGRNLDGSDRADAPTVCMIDRHLADRFFPNQDPIGQEIAMYKGWARIVGIVAAIRADGLEERTRPVVYYSLPQVPFFAQSAAIVRSNAPAGSLIREAVRRTNASVPVFDVRTMEERIGESLGIRRVLAALLSVFGGISLLLAAIGIYGVIAQVVAERTQEVGIRMALGARPAQILRQFMGQGLRAGGLGLVLGAVVTVYVQKWIGTLLYQVRAFDTATLGAASVGILMVLVVAVWLPARRASRIDAQTALRHE